MLRLANDKAAEARMQGKSDARGRAKKKSRRLSNANECTYSEHRASIVSQLMFINAHLLYTVVGNLVFRVFDQNHR